MRFWLSQTKPVVRGWFDNKTNHWYKYLCLISHLLENIALQIYLKLALNLDPCFKESLFITETTAIAVHQLFSIALPHHKILHPLIKTQAYNCTMARAIYEGKMKQVAVNRFSVIRPHK